MAGSGVGAKNGILFKTGEALEAAGKADIAALDKTGTVTRGQPAVTDLLPAPGVSREELLRAACTLKHRQGASPGRGLVRAAEAGGIAPGDLRRIITALPGNGLTGKAGGKTLAGGSGAWFRSLGIPIDNAGAEALAGQGKTPLFFAKDGRLLGVIAVADVIREDSAGAIESFRLPG